MQGMIHLPGCEQGPSQGSLNVSCLDQEWGADDSSPRAGVIHLCLQGNESCGFCGVDLGIWCFDVLQTLQICWIPVPVGERQLDPAGLSL